MSESSMVMPADLSWMRHMDLSVVDGSVPQVGETVQLCVTHITDDGIVYGQRYHWRRQLRVQAILLRLHYTGKRAQILANSAFGAKTSILNQLPVEEPLCLKLADLTRADGDLDLDEPNCAAQLADGGYYRATILPEGRVSPSHVKVYLMDYGSEVDVPYWKLYVLPDVFKRLPSSVLSCVLHHHEMDVGDVQTLRDRLDGVVISLKIEQIDHSTNLLYGHFQV